MTSGTIYEARTVCPTCEGKGYICPDCIDGTVPDDDTSCELRSGR